MSKYTQILLALLLMTVCVNAQTSFSFAIVPTNSYACTGLQTGFTATSQSQGLSYTWSVSPAKFATLSNTTGEVVFGLFTKDVSYTITATASDGSTQLTKSIALVAYRSALASFNASLNTTGYPAQLELTNYSSFVNKSTWLFSDDATVDSSYSTVKSYTTSGNYTTTLIAYGQKNCNDTSAFQFTIPDSSSLVLPNIFTPNRDEVNDFFRPISTGLVELKAHVFNRNGILLANWDTVNGSWDGRTASGEVCPDGVYIVVVEAKGFDGKTFKLSSTLTLLR